MAEIGIAVLSSFLSMAFDRMATPEFINFFSRRKFNHGSIEKLKTKMIAFSSILDDAEEKQFASKEVRAWLLKLKEAAYDAEDLLDEILIEYQAHQERSSSSVLKKFWMYSLMLPRNSLTTDLESKLKEILQRLEYLMGDSATFGLSKAVGEKRSLENRKTTSLIADFEGLYGRDAEKKAIIDMLSSEDDGRSNLGVIPIVGMGGVGKTTLAQLVYNDKAVAEQFQIRAWVCVSDQFDETKVTKEIVEQVNRAACHSNDLDRLQHQLKDALGGKKFLLVLDDVWCEEYGKWEHFLTPFKFGAQGSKVLVTTRSKEVTLRVRTVPPYDLGKLEDEDCWKLFAKHADLDLNSTANALELREIRKEIVKKCGGLPLAAKALGGVLRCQTEKWKQVLRSEIWDVESVSILPALAISYIHLPSHLKRCFAYCAIFPQDYKFEKEELVALWMSEGFLVQQRGNQSLEEVGDMYFEDLVSRSFFQHSSTTRGGPCIVMHDLVHDLARFVSGEFCSRLEGGTPCKIGERTRHLSYERSQQDVLKKFQGILETPFLRSFVLAQQSWYDCSRWRPKTCIDEKVIYEFLPTWKLVRVLSLSCYKIIELPDSIGNLKHMRHLDLSSTSIRLLPEVVTALFNLEILILRDCADLVELPADMAKLINLCQLDVRGTKKLKGMPPEMGKLKKLSKLTDFVVGENGGYSIKELGNLHSLRGEISIRGLENVKDDWDASEAILKDKENLKRLNLRWDRDADDSRQVKQVLERLQPHVEVEHISIGGYGGTQFPHWVGDISFLKLKALYLYGFKNCLCLPPLGQLASLEMLSISGESDDDTVLDAIGLEFYGTCRPGEKPFSSLKILKILRMKNWREWSSLDGAFPVLEELELSQCPKLTSVPSHSSNLKRLRIKDCPELDFDNLLISACASLETIYIGGSEKVKWMSLETCPNLKSMELYFCRKLRSLPQGMHFLLPSLQKLTISGCPEIESFPEGGLPSKLQSLDVTRCKKLVGGRMQWGLQSLPCLTRVSIGGRLCEDVESFPEEMLLPSSLQSLQISSFAKLKSLDYKGLQHLTSLQSLAIYYCQNLEFLPEEGLPSCLSSLRIDGCPLLQKRCRREIGEDWPKIKHIPDLFILER